MSYEATHLRAATQGRDLIVPTVMVDADSTLCNTVQRHYLAPKDPKNGDWVPFSNACIDDTLIEGTAAVVRLLYPTHRIVICSGRNHTAYENSEKWFASNDVPYDELYLCNYEEMRKPDGEHITNGEYKVHRIKEQRERGYDVVLFIEDFVLTAEAIEAVGVPVLCVNPRYQGERKAGPGEVYVVSPPRLI